MFRKSVLIFSLLLLAASCKAPVHVKEPSVAGSFYPLDRGVLQNTVDSLLMKAELQPEADAGRLIALLSPHAGYEFSGWVAAYGYKRLREMRDIDTVILIGSSHRMTFTGASVYTEGRFKTPLGEIEIDEELATGLLKKEANVTFLREAFDGEHSLEVQLPFLQRVLEDFSIVPVLISRPTREMYQHLAAKFAGILASNDKAVVVVSSDMSHYFDHETAIKKDGKMIDALERISLIDIESLLRTKEAELCGSTPVIVTLDAARRVGANRTSLYKYGTSGDVLEKMKNNVVGYVSMGFYKSGLTGEDKKELLALARKAVTERVKEGRITVYETDNPRLKTDGAAFVTIDRQGMLRGCIGHIRPFMPLYKSVIRNAGAACARDHRFKPMTPEELKDMEIEISVLSPLVPINGIEEIELGKHGVYLVVEQSSAIFLPLVPLEFGWDKAEMLRQLSLKAGLKPDDWKHGELYKFEAEVFKEGH
jgi:AmmeMemoRadiSam system protein B/AmmeMemoRadiSam system protein A